MPTFNAELLEKELFLGKKNMHEYTYVCICVYTDRVIHPEYGQKYVHPKQCLYTPHYTPECSYML